MRYIVGIDEVGRGCLAGPVTVAAFAMSENFKINPKFKLRDSKRLSASQREEWFGQVSLMQNIFYSVASVSPRVIDRINISAAANRAAHKALAGLTKTPAGKPHKIYLDGGLYIKNKKYQKESFANAETVIKGDEKIKAVSLASIVAKVSRDRYMKKLHKKHPVYSFDVHKGYGTKIHSRALAKHGPSPAHRLTFLKNYNSIKP